MMRAKTSNGADKGYCGHERTKDQEHPSACQCGCCIENGAVEHYPILPPLEAIDPGSIDISKASLKHCKSVVSSGEDVLVDQYCRIGNR